MVSLVIGIPMVHTHRNWVICLKTFIVCAEFCHDIRVTIANCLDQYAQRKELKF